MQKRINIRLIYFNVLQHIFALCLILRFGFLVSLIGLVRTFKGWTKVYPLFFLSRNFNLLKINLKSICSFLGNNAFV